MKGMVPDDPMTHVSDFQFAVVYAPRKNRKRFPAGCVTVVTTKEQALTEDEPEEHRYAATVHGPSKSSEGQYIYYLLEWL